MRLHEEDSWHCHPLSRGRGGGGWRWFGKWIREVSLVAINGDFSLEHGLEMSLVSRYRANQI